MIGWSLLCQYKQKIDYYTSKTDQTKKKNMTLCKTQILFYSYEKIVGAAINATQLRNDFKKYL